MPPLLPRQVYPATVCPPPTLLVGLGVVFVVARASSQQPIMSTRIQQIATKTSHLFPWKFLGSVQFFPPGVNVPAEKIYREELPCEELPGEESDAS